MFLLHGPDDVDLPSSRRKGPQAAANALVRWCIDRLAYFKAPGYVAFVDSLPVTSTQKIHRRGVKDLVSELFAGGRYIDTRPLKKRDVAAAS